MVLEIVFPVLQMVKVSGAMLRGVEKVRDGALLMAVYLCVLIRDAVEELKHLKETLWFLLENNFQAQVSFGVK